ncbi:MAG TPA: hypothetical protein VJN89_08440 [Candidatus Acidoferrum sp.]|nr:hypothetical protein [Candidatus Acidoferrum sp.]
MIKVDAQVRGGRPLAVFTAVLFVVSSIFPVGAGLAKDPEAFPTWWGRLDVGIAFFLAALVLLVMALASSKFSKPVEDATYRAYRVLIHGLWVMLVVFFLWGDRIAWKYCLVGLAWRAWLLLYSLPAWFTVSRRGEQV